MKEIVGLTSAEVWQRKREGLDNKPVKAPSKTVREIIFSNVFTYFNFVFLLITVFLVLVRSYRDLTFLLIILTNTAIGILQEMRARIELNKIMLLAMPRAKVLRDGEEKEVLVRDLVKNDVVIFVAGNQIPADAKVLEGRIAVNEALLTGEADEIMKKPGDNLLSGSFVVSGNCYAKLTEVGAQSYISKLTLAAKKIKNREQSEIIRSLNMVVKAVGATIIPIGGVLFCQQYFLSHMPIRESVQSMVAAVIGIIPEGLFLLASVALAISAMRLARNKVLVHDMKSIETLARVDMLCVDKTGTITEEKMSVADFWPLDNMGRIELEELLGDFVQAQENDTTTMEALRDRFVRKGGRAVKAVTGFSSIYKYSGVQFGEDSYVLGAPDLILGQVYKQLRDEIENHSRRGYRVLLLAKYKGKLEVGKKLIGEVVPCGLITLTNLVRKSAPATFRYFAEQNVQIKVISGDNVKTVAEVVKQAGILGAENFVDASILRTEKDIAAAVEKYTVFGRVSPEQKRKMIRALKKAGHVVAMMGDGVNDVLALKDADCSIAMASGSDVAAQSAQLVLVESDFAKMPEVMREGRRVVNNLECSGSLFLVKNIFSLITALLVIIFGIIYPLTPAQVSLISMFTIGIPGFLLSQVPSERLIRGKFIKNIILRALPGGIINVVFTLLIIVVGRSLGLNNEEVSTSCTMLLCVVGMMMVYQASQPLDLAKWMVLGLCGMGLVISVVFLRPLFGLADKMSLTSNLLWLACVTWSWPLLKMVEKVIRVSRWKVFDKSLGKSV